MRFRKFMVVLCFVTMGSALMATSHGEILYLKDGSKINGKLVKLVADTLMFRTSFGSEVRIPRDRVLRIDFADSLALNSLQAAGDVAPAAPGSLMVAFDKFEVTSRVTVHRNKDREQIERANSILQILKVDGQVVYAYRDSVTDKVVRDGPDTILKNNMKPQSFAVKLPSGPHRFELSIGNSDAGEFANAFVKGGFVEYSLVLESVLVPADETSLLRVRMKKKKLGLGKGQLVVVQ